jgi:predicted MFS family arabinose efflux permease
MMMKTTGHKVTSTSRTALEGLLQGFTYLKKQRSISSVILLGITMGLFGSSFDTLLPVFADEIYETGLDVGGKLLLGAGIGGLTATTAITLIGKRVRPALYLIVSGIGLGAAQLVFAQIDVIEFAIFIAAVIGGFKVVLGTMNTTVVQTLVYEEFRGRVMSINQLTWGASALGGLMMGYLAQQFDAPFAMTVGGTIAILATVLVGQRLIRSFGIGSKPNQKSDPETQSAS